MDLVGVRLKQDHQQLIAQLQEVASALSAPAEGSGTAPLPTTELWAEFESRLIAHIEAEERHLFDLLKLEFPAETVALREEHGQIRALLAELGDNAAAPQKPIAQLTKLLERHARREDGLLYALAERAPSRVQEETLEYQMRLRSSLLEMAGSDND